MAGTVDTSVVSHPELQNKRIRRRRKARSVSSVTTLSFLPSSLSVSRCYHSGTGQTTNFWSKVGERGSPVLRKHGEEDLPQCTKSIWLVSRTEGRKKEQPCPPRASSSSAVRSCRLAVSPQNLYNSYNSVANRVMGHECGSGGNQTHRFGIQDRGESVGSRKRLFREKTSFLGHLGPPRREEAR